MGQNVGARIRTRRLDLGLRQAELAQAAGISPSYLNLIEHDKRRIAVDVLALVAEHLDVAPELLTDGADPRVLDAMRAAASAPDVAPELEKLDELASRYPGWAALIAAQKEQIDALQTQAQVLTDRITYDPAVATALHGMISAVTAIRSTASILTSGEVLDAEWLARFHRNIDKDAKRLAADSEALIGFLDAPAEKDALPVSPLEEVERWLDAQSWHLPMLETEGASAIAELVATADLRQVAKGVLSDICHRYAQDASALPMSILSDALAAANYDPWRIAGVLNQPLDRVIRRMACLPPDAGHPLFGLVTCDAGGFPVVLKQVPSFTVPRGAACPLLPVYTALGQPERPVQGTVAIPGQPDVPARCTAVATQIPAVARGMPPRLSAVMLVQPNPGSDDPADTLVPVGIACRICPRDRCDARREPSALSIGT